MRRHNSEGSTNHQRLCLKHNRLNAVLSLVLSASVLAAAIPELFRPFSGQREQLRVTLGVLYLIAVTIWAIVRWACSYDRLWLGFVLGGGFLGVLKGSFPALVAPAISAIRVAALILWLGATIISIWLTRSAFRSRPREPTTGAQRSG
jgi:hypothetical protein